MVEQISTNEQCSSCASLKQELELSKKEQTATLKMIKEKIISTDKLIKKYQKKCDDFEKQAKLLTDLTSKHEECKRNAEDLQKQLNHALEITEPQRKNITRLIQEKFTNEQKILDLKKQNQELEGTISSLQSSLQGKEDLEIEWKKDKQAQEKKLEKEKERVAKLQADLRKVAEEKKSNAAALRQKGREHSSSVKTKEKLEAEITRLKEQIRSLKSKNNTDQYANTPAKESSDVSENPRVLRSGRHLKAPATKLSTRSSHNTKPSAISTNTDVADIFDKIQDLDIPVLSPLPQEHNLEESSSSDSENEDEHSDDGSLSDLGDALQMELENRSSDSDFNADNDNEQRSELRNKDMHSRDEMMEMLSDDDDNSIGLQKEKTSKDMESSDKISCEKQVDEGGASNVNSPQENEDLTLPSEHKMITYEYDDYNNLVDQQTETKKEIQIVKKGPRLHSKKKRIKPLSEYDGRSLDQQNEIGGNIKSVDKTPCENVLDKGADTSVDLNCSDSLNTSSSEQRLHKIENFTSKKDKDPGSPVDDISLSGKNSAKNNPVMDEKVKDMSFSLVDATESNTNTAQQHLGNSASDIYERPDREEISAKRLKLSDSVVSEQKSPGFCKKTPFSSKSQNSKAAKTKMTKKDLQLSNVDGKLFDQQLGDCNSVNTESNDVTDNDRQTSNGIELLDGKLSKTGIEENVRETLSSDGELPIIEMSIDDKLSDIQDDTDNQQSAETTCNALTLEICNVSLHNTKNDKVKIDNENALNNDAGGVRSDLQSHFNPQENKQRHEHISSTTKAFGPRLQLLNERLSDEDDDIIKTQKTPQGNEMPLLQSEDTGLSDAKDDVKLLDDTNDDINLVDDSTGDKRSISDRTDDTVLLDDESNEPKCNQRSYANNNVRTIKQTINLPRTHLRVELRLKSNIKDASVDQDIQTSEEDSLPSLGKSVDHENQSIIHKGTTVSVTEIEHNKLTMGDNNNNEKDLNTSARSSNDCKISESPSSRNSKKDPVRRSTGTHGFAKIRTRVSFEHDQGIDKRRKSNDGMNDEKKGENRKNNVNSGLVITTNKEQIEKNLVMNAQRLTYESQSSNKIKGFENSDSRDVNNSSQYHLNLDAHIDMTDLDNESSKAIENTVEKTNLTFIKNLDANKSVSDQADTSTSTGEKLDEKKITPDKSLEGSEMEWEESEVSSSKMKKEESGNEGFQSLNQTRRRIAHRLIVTPRNSVEKPSSRSGESKAYSSKEENISERHQAVGQVRRQVAHPPILRPDKSLEKSSSKIESFKSKTSSEEKIINERHLADDLVQSPNQSLEKSSPKVACCEIKTSSSKKENINKRYQAVGQVRKRIAHCAPLTPDKSLEKPTPKAEPEETKFCSKGKNVNECHQAVSRIRRRIAHRPVIRPEKCRIKFRSSNANTNEEKGNDKQKNDSSKSREVLDMHQTKSNEDGGLSSVGHRTDDELRAKRKSCDKQSTTGKRKKGDHVTNLLGEMKIAPDFTNSLGQQEDTKVLKEFKDFRKGNEELNEDNIKTLHLSTLSEEQVYEELPCKNVGIDDSSHLGIIGQNVKIDFQINVETTKQGFNDAKTSSSSKIINSRNDILINHNAQGNSTSESDVHMCVEVVKRTLDINNKADMSDKYLNVSVIEDERKQITMDYHDDEIICDNIPEHNNITVGKHDGEKGVLVVADLSKQDRKEEKAAMVEESNDNKLVTGDAFKVKEECSIVNEMPESEVLVEVLAEEGVKEVSSGLSLKLQELDERFDDCYFRETLQQFCDGNDDSAQNALEKDDKTQIFRDNTDLISHVVSKCTSTVETQPKMKRLRSQDANDHPGRKHDKNDLEVGGLKAKSSFSCMEENTKSIQQISSSKTQLALDSSPSIADILNDTYGVFTGIVPVLDPIPPSPTTSPPASTERSRCCSQNFFSSQNLFSSISLPRENYEEQLSSGKTQGKSSTQDKKVENNDHLISEYTKECGVSKKKNKRKRKKAKKKVDKFFATRPAFLSELQYTTRALKHLYANDVHMNEITKRLSNKDNLSNITTFAAALMVFKNEEDFMPIIIQYYGERNRVQMMRHQEESKAHHDKSKDDREETKTEFPQSINCRQQAASHQQKASDSVQPLDARSQSIPNRQLSLLDRKGAAVCDDLSAIHSKQLTVKELHVKPNIEPSASESICLISSFEQRVMELLKKLEQLDYLKGVSSLVITYLAKAILYSYTKLSKEGPDKRSVASYCRIMCCLCRQEGDLSRMRTLCYDIMRHLHGQPGTALYHLTSIAAVWPAVLAYPSQAWIITPEGLHFCGTSHQPLLSTIHVVVMHLVRVMDWVMLGNIINWLCAWKKVNPGEAHLDELFEGLVKLMRDPKFAQLIGDKDGYPVLGYGLYEVVKSLELIACSHGWVWLNNVLIRGVIWDVLSTWAEKNTLGQNQEKFDASDQQESSCSETGIDSKKDSNKEQSDIVCEPTVVATVRLLGLVCRLAIQQQQSVIPYVIPMLLGLLNNTMQDTKVTFAIQLATAYSLLEVSAWQPQEIAAALVSWKEDQLKKRSLPESLIQGLSSLQLPVINTKHV